MIVFVRVLATQNQAFPGTNEKLHWVGIGNLLKFLDYMVSFDLINEHLRKVHDNEMIVHCLHKEIQNELVQLLVNSTKEKHLAKVNLVKNFSI